MVLEGQGSVITETLHNPKTEVRQTVVGPVTHALSRLLMSNLMELIVRVVYCPGGGVVVVSGSLVEDPLVFYLGHEKYV